MLICLIEGCVCVCVCLTVCAHLWMCWKSMFTCSLVCFECMIRAKWSVLLIFRPHEQFSSVCAGCCSVLFCTISLNQGKNGILMCCEWWGATGPLYLPRQTRFLSLCCYKDQVIEMLMWQRTDCSGFFLEDKWKSLWWIPLWYSTDVWPGLWQL